MRPDYADSGLDIQRAMVAETKRLGKQASHPLSILWNRRDVQTADRIDAPTKGRVRIEFVSARPQPKQAIDLEVPKGRMTLPDGSTVSHLRTWYDPDLPTVVEYSYQAREGGLWVSNAYERLRGSEIVVERWTGTAGMMVDTVGATERLYHCSPGGLEHPDFDFLLVRVNVNP